MATEAPSKCPYRLRWEFVFSPDSTKTKAHDGEVRRMKLYHCRDANCWIRETPEGWTVSSSVNSELNFTVSETGKKGLSQARKEAQARDWKRVTRNHLTKVEEGVWEASNGRIRVVKMTNQELTKALPSGHVAGGNGYGIYLDDKFIECAFTVRQAQMEISIPRRVETPYDMMEGS